MIRSFPSDSSRCTDALDASVRSHGKIESALIREYQVFSRREPPLTSVVSAGLRLLSGLLACLPRRRHEDEPGAAVLRDLGLDHETRRSIFDFADIHHGLESGRMRSPSQGWRGS